jgi:hypothetical protein
MRISASIDCLVASLALASAFTSPSSPSTLFVDRHRCANNGNNHHGVVVVVGGGGRGTTAATTSLGMFDQLSSALTEVARNFGGKQR